MIRLVGVLLYVALVSLMSLVFEGAKVWLLVKPWKRFRAWRGRRKREKSAWAEHHLDEIAEDFNQTDEERKPMAIDLGTRTSTNAGAAGLAVVWLCQIVEQFAPGLLGANADDYLIVAVAWLVARFSKTPDSPGKL